MIWDEDINAPVAVPVRILRTVRMRLSGAGDEAVKAEFANAAEEFFTEVPGWVNRFKTDLVEGQTDYPIELPNGEPITVLDVLADGRHYRPIPADKLHPTTQSAVYHWDWAEKTLRLAPVPATTQADKLEVLVSIAPKPGSAEISPAAADRHFRALVNGTMGYMLSHINRPYSNERQAMMYIRRFRGQIAKEKVAIARGHSQSDMGFMFPQVAPGGTPRTRGFPRGL